MTRRELIEYCLNFPGAMEDYPFEDRYNTIMRHTGKGKWFAAILEKDGKLGISLKCDPMEADFLRSVYADVTPAWHFNKTHCHTVTLGGDVPEQALFAMIQSSFDLTKPKKTPALSDNSYPRPDAGSWSCALMERSTVGRLSEVFKAFSIIILRKKCISKIVYVSLQSLFVSTIFLYT